MTWPHIDGPKGRGAAFQRDAGSDPKVVEQLGGGLSAIGNNRTPKEQAARPSYDVAKIKAELAKRSVALCTELLGRDPNKALSTGASRRWGDNGRFVLNVHDAIFCDHSDGSGGDLLELIRVYKGCDFRTALEFAANYVGARPIDDGVTYEQSRPVDTAEADARAISYAQSIVARSRPIKGTLAEKYLRLRGLDVTPSPNILWDSYECAIVYVMRRDGKPVAVQLVAINPDGTKNKAKAWNRKKPDDRRARHTVGRMFDCCVQLAEAGEILGLAEGPETALAASILFNMPVWATLGAGRTYSVAIPASVKELHLFGDNDSASERALARCRFTQRVTTHRPTIGSDYNDQLLAMGAGHDC